ncbi:MAG TPA: hypothetical protein PL045_02215 [Chitinophagaceae bacterium]|nr:hypothetical protein [Chitinophagaceae bacterium]
MIIDKLPLIKNRKAKLLILLEDDEKPGFYELSATWLSKAYSDEESEYELSFVKEPNPEYKKPVAQ